MPEFDLKARYKVNGYSNGIAWYCVGYEREADEWGDVTENTERVRMIMVGDDRVETFDIEELTKLTDDEYCPECGQIGCTAYAGVYSDV